MAIQGVSFNVIEVGKIVKKSKRRFTWNFLVDGDGYIVEMIASHISHKKRLFLNHEIIYEATKAKERKETKNSWHFTFQIGTNICTVTQNGDNYDLQINDQTFDQLCHNKTTEFVFEPKQKAPSALGASKPTQATTTVKHEEKKEEKREEPLPAFSNTQLFKDDLGDLRALRGVRTNHPESANNTNSATLKENKPAQANVAHTNTQPTAVHKEHNIPTENQPKPETSKSKLGDLGSMIGLKKNKDAPKAEQPPIQENKPAQTKAAPPQTKDTKAEKEQSAQKPTTFKEKIGNVASGLKHAVTKNKDNEPKENKANNDKTTTPPQSGTLKEQSAPPVVHTMATFQEIMKQEVGDLSGLRGVRKKKNPYDEDPSAKENQSVNTNVNLPHPRIHEPEVKQEQVHRDSTYTMPTTLTAVMKDELGDLSGIRGTRKTIATEPTYTSGYAYPPPTENYEPEPTYARQTYSPPKQNYNEQNYDYSAQQKYSPPQEYREPEYSQPGYSQPEYRQQEYREPEYKQPEYRQPEYQQQQQYQQQTYNKVSPPKPVAQKIQPQQQYATTNPFAGSVTSNQAGSSTQNIFDQFGGFANNTAVQQNAFNKQDPFASFSAFNPTPTQVNFAAQNAHHFKAAAPHLTQMATSVPAQNAVKQVAQNYPNQFPQSIPNSNSVPNLASSFKAPPVTNNNKVDDNFDWDYSGFGNKSASQNAGNNMMGGFNNMGFNNNANTGFNNVAAAGFNAGFNNFNQNNWANNNNRNTQNLVQDLL